MFPAIARVGPALRKCAYLLVTSNKPFRSCGEIFGDNVIARDPPSPRGQSAAPA